MSNVKTTATYNEIVTQPAAWAQAIEKVEQAAGSLGSLSHSAANRRFLVTGCGSTYYVSQAVAVHLQEAMPVPAQAVPASELWLNAGSVYPAGSPAVLIAFSRSGTTSETIAAVRKFRRDGGGPVIVVTNYGDSPLAGLGDITIAVPAGQEISVAQTRSFASMYVAGLALSFTLARDQEGFEALHALPAIGDRLISEADAVVRPLGEDLALDRFYFLGSGPRYGLACEVNLKMKEMSLTHSEPFHFLEFRHGPMSMAGQSTCMVGLLSEENDVRESAVLNEMAARNAHVLSLGESSTHFDFHSGLPSRARNVLYLPPLQLMALYRSLKKGLNPDRPENLTAVVNLEID